ncbi:retrovirus-related pol polyprotein from transposon TNT 1-94 [Tanacetum coccineum]|uniref:Retrovirus-related pol polyprotein from transposon TNT 1-94 n=1 Tax=Tanacetum coccineum TaxID=301880 RepID=A0ABQ5AT21_9ASTR
MLQVQGEILQLGRQELLNATTAKVKDIWLGNALSLSNQGMLHDPGILASQAPTVIPHNAVFQTEDLDTYDSDCDDLSNAQAVLMANISNYGSAVISEVPNSETYLNDMDNQSVHALQDFEQSPVMDFTDNEISSDSNIIPYSQYLQETEQANELLYYGLRYGHNALIPSAKKVTVKPMNNVKKVRFAKPLTSSSNIKQVESSNTSDSNTPVLSSTGVKCSTSNCGSKPPGNKKNDRISQTPSRNKKNKVEAQPRKVNKVNCVFNPVCDVDVMHSLCLDGTLDGQIVMIMGYGGLSAGKHYYSGLYYGKARTPQQNGVVERLNWTLVKAARTMLIFSKAPLFLWAEAINTACYTQNHSLIRLRYNKTPYELMQDKKPDLSFFYVFGSLCYPTNDHEDLGKFDAKANIGIFVGYVPAKKASGPGLQGMTPATSSTGLDLNPVSEQPCLPPIRDD